jgi:hypothetical protein
MPLGNACDLEVTPGIYCNKPVTWLALSGDAPEMWADHPNGTASLAAFCSYTHAKAEPRPNLAAAKRQYAQIAEMTNEKPVIDGWERAIAAYPRPVPYAI